MLQLWRPPRPVKPSRWPFAGLCALTVLAAGLGARWWLNARAAATQPQTALQAPLQSPATQKRQQPIVRLAILVFKSEKSMEVWGQSGGAWRQLRAYPILAASGAAGPKLREGDRQVPEGVYRIAALLPNSKFHLALKLDYPNDFDKKMAERDGRRNLGGDICIHGKNCSIGCVAIGDPAIEDLYALVEQVKPANVKIILAPNDLRHYIPVRNPFMKQVWLDELYETLKRELSSFKATPRS